MYGLPLWKYLPAYCSPAFTNLVKHKDTLFEIIGKIVDESLADMNRADKEDGKEDDLSILRQLLRNPGKHKMDATPLNKLFHKLGVLGWVDYLTLILAVPVSA